MPDSMKPEIEDDERQSNLAGNHWANENMAPPRKRPRISHENGARDDAALTFNHAGANKKMTFAERQMAKMGWKAGQGLGAEGTGRLNPIEVVQRPTRTGVGTVREKTKQVKQEENRARELKGETIDDSSEEERKRKKTAKQAKQAGRAAGAPIPRTQLRKPKYISADDLEAELQSSHMPRSLLEFAIDLSGRQLSDQNNGNISGFTTSNSTVSNHDEVNQQARRMRSELVACAESKHGMKDQGVTLADLEHHLVGNIDRQREEALALESLLQAATDLQATITAGHGFDNSFWENIAARLETMAEGYLNEQSLAALQEVAVAAIQPAFRSSMADWEPLNQPKYLVHPFQRLKPIFSTRAAPVLHQTSDLEARRAHRHARSNNYYDTLIFSLWLPRVSSAARNDFQVERPEPMIKLVKSWKPLIPHGAYANLMNQIIIPRILSALKSWKPSRSSNRSANAPDSWIFPWLELLPAHQLDAHSANSMLAEVKRKLRKLVSTHPLEAGIPGYLPPWRELLGSAFSNLLASYLLPRLAAHMAQRFAIDPADQDLGPIETVLSYAPLFPTDTMARLLAAEFFPKFHSTLYKWLIAPTVNYDEVTEWWTWWKAQIPAEIRDHQELQSEWTEALNKIGRALDLGPRASQDLDPPKAPQTVSNAAGIAAAQSSAPDTVPALDASNTSKIKAAPLQELKFRDIITDWCEEHDLLCLPTREAHAGTGESILRITASADQRGGVLAYARGDVLYVRNKKDRSLWTPMELGPELELRASER